MNLNRNIRKWLINRYTIVLFLFIIWMLFFDENSFLNHNEFNHELNKLKKQKKYYKEEIKADKELIQKLNNKEQLETFAREKYHMKKENEDIFIINYDTLPKK